MKHLAQKKVATSQIKLFRSLQVIRLVSLGRFCVFTSAKHKSIVFSQKQEDRETNNLEAGKINLLIFSAIRWNDRQVADRRGLRSLYKQPYPQILWKTADAGALGLN